MSRLLEIDGYPLPWPSKGWSPPRRNPRVVVDRTQGGAAIHVGTGAYADAGLELSWDLETRAEETLLQTVDDYATQVRLGPDSCAAIATPIAVTDFAAIGCVSVLLKRTGDPTGRLHVEVWDGDGEANPAPQTKVGSLGSIDAADVTTSFATYYFWREDVAWPLTDTGFLVLNASALSRDDYNYLSTKYNELASGGVVKVAGDPWEYNPAVVFKIPHSAWESKDANVIAGLAQAYGEQPGVTAGLRTLTMDDGQRYSCRLQLTRSAWRVKPMSYDEIGQINLSLGVIIVDALDEVAVS